MELYYLCTNVFELHHFSQWTRPQAVHQPCAYSSCHPQQPWTSVGTASGLAASRLQTLGETAPAKDHGTSESDCLSLIMRFIGATKFQLDVNLLQDPPQQPNLDIVAQLKQNAARKNPSYMRRQESVKESRISANEDFLKTPQGGFAQNARESIRGA